MRMEERRPRRGGLVDSGCTIFEAEAEYARMGRYRASP